MPHIPLPGAVTREIITALAVNWAQNQWVLMVQKGPCKFINKPVLRSMVMVDFWQQERWETATAAVGHGEGLQRPV